VGAGDTTMQIRSILSGRLAVAIVALTIIGV
jgi:hypothetical protein